VQFCNSADDIVGADCCSWQANARCAPGWR